MAFNQIATIFVFFAIASLGIIELPKVFAEPSEITLFFPKLHNTDDKIIKEIGVKVNNYSPEEGPYYLKIFSSESKLVIKKEINMTQTSQNGVAKAMVSYVIPAEITKHGILCVSATHGPSKTIPIKITNTSQDADVEINLDKKDNSGNVLSEWFSKSDDDTGMTEIKLYAKEDSSGNILSEWFSKSDDSNDVEINLDKKDDDSSGNILSEWFSKSDDDKKIEKKDDVVKQKNTKIILSFPNGNNIEKQKDADGVTVRINVMVINYDPRHGYYYMKITDPNGEIIQDNEIFLQNRGHTWIVYGGTTLTNQNLNGQYFIQVYTDSGPQANSRFTVSGLQ